MAGIGAAINTGNVGRGDSVAVFGCGGVGDAAIAGARLAGAHTIIAVDIDDRKLEWAKEFGATHTCNSRTTDPVEYIKSVTGGNGADVCIEAIGNPDVYRQAFEARDLAGTVVLVGVPRPDMKLELPFIEVFGRGGALKSSWYGDCLPSRDFPMLVTLHQQGRLPTRQVRQRDHLARRRRGGLPQDGAWRGAAQRRRAVTVRVTIELVTTDGIFALDGGEWQVTNNIWLVGDDREVVVFDAAHDAAPIVEAINGRRVRAIVLTHGHNDHINAAVPLRDAVDAPVLLHDADRMLWDVVWPDDQPDARDHAG